MKVVTPQQMSRIFEVTDALAIHREAIVVPLDPSGGGDVQLSGNKVEIVVPEEGDFDAWLNELPGRISKLDLSSVRRAEEE